MDQLDNTTTEALEDMLRRRRLTEHAPMLQLASKPDLARTPAQSSDLEHLLARYRERTATVAVVGLGYVGLPLSLAACEAGFKVIGYDIDARTVEHLNGSRSPLQHIADERIGKIVAAERFAATTDAARFKEADAILICVPTPLGSHHEPDLSFVEATAHTIARHLRRGHLVVLESTTYPGTTTEVMKPILEASGLKSGEDFFLAYSPEREDPGNAQFETARIPKVVSGDGEAALALCNALYEQFVKTVPVSSPETAEAVKLTENIFRSVNIALVNELKIVYDRMGIDIWEVIEAAKSKPFGYMPFYPGPGLGGHCIPIDPFYLTWKARELGIATRFIELAGEVNNSMPHYVVSRTRDELDRRFHKGLSNSRILVVGIAYKKNVSDMRESPALTIMELFDKAGAKVDYYDPYFATIPPTRQHADLAGKACVPFEDYALARYDAAVIVTDHDDVDYAKLLRFSKLVVDTRNAVGALGLPETPDTVAKA
ncbi:nucleotide sugar dehydrogenase [Azospirillum sp. TSO22-1]|uniref:nucleotide sugar dehydrogenase n=1 Tax=Azospirillum sp. TSO22-1 TaxID=716789 RepID=UPI001FFFCED9|nr:nucleotide sugar dehydrogenase [Azospirillum sp. TSO22-1]